MHAALLSLLPGLVVVEQTLHSLHRPPRGVAHLECPERLVAAREALEASPFHVQIEWRSGVASSYSAEDAVSALKRVHTIDHLRTVQRMSTTGGGFDSDTYWRA